jgi:hypothetical protein
MQQLSLMIISISNSANFFFQIPVVKTKPSKAPPITGRSDNGVVNVAEYAFQLMHLHLLKKYCQHF